MSATNLLILLMAVGYIFTFLPAPVASYLGFSTLGLLQCHFWTLVTSLFIHVGLVHLAGNMLFLYVFGNALEKEVGPGKTIGLFFFGGILSLLVGIPFNSPYTHIVGSSSAVSTFVGGVLILKPHKVSPLFFFSPVGLVAVVYLIYNGFMIYYGQPGGIAYVSHIIGFIIGTIFGLIWRRKKSHHPS